MSGITGQQKFISLARARGFAGILLGTEKAPRGDKKIDRKDEDHNYELTDAEREEKKRLRQANYLMTWSPSQKQKNSQMDSQEMHGKD